MIIEELLQLGFDAGYQQYNDLECDSYGRMTRWRGYPEDGGIFGLDLFNRAYIISRPMIFNFRPARTEQVHGRICIFQKLISEPTLDMTSEYPILGEDLYKQRLIEYGLAMIGGAERVWYHIPIGSSVIRVDIRQ